MVAESVHVPALALEREMVALAPLAITPANCPVPEPPSVSVLDPLPVAVVLLLKVSVPLPLLIIVAPPVVPARLMILSVVSPSPV